MEIIVENVKAAVANQVNEFTTDPVQKTINFAVNVLGAAVVIWFSSLIIASAMRIVGAAYSILAHAV